jgi:hypothetical protein
MCWHVLALSAQFVLHSVRLSAQAPCPSFISLRLMKKPPPPPLPAAAGTSSVATEHTEEPQLAELVNQDAGLSCEIDLKVIRNEIMEYTYPWNGTPVASQKLQIILQSKIPEQYCLGVAHLAKKDKNELKKMADRWQTGTTWRFKTITLLNDKAAYIHTPCRITIDLRKSQALALLQSTSFPQAPMPTVTIL